MTGADVARAPSLLPAWTKTLDQSVLPSRKARTSVAATIKRESEREQRSDVTLTFRRRCLSATANWAGSPFRRRPVSLFWNWSSGREAGHWHPRSSGKSASCVGLVLAHHPVDRLRYGPAACPQPRLTGQGRFPVPGCQRLSTSALAGTELPIHVDPAGHSGVVGETVADVLQLHGSLLVAVAAIVESRRSTGRWSDRER